ncbi:type II toxin-antitoxin system RelE/ParE family toxin [Ruminococcus sp. NK3A76]|uniref:type II toxin-antitoxin system RelE/ParE family toxin n=1 Tax=Ruminococcus sp. NK3A76 TaxID=877411 RepID=UPI0005683B1D|nr:type II toxin-antitoxin system RelE/ParE family toxin [Ruminococcus sp. NK3A76]
MACDYELTDKAAADLDETVRYISLTLGDKKAAADFLDKFEKVTEEACMFPESGELLNNEFLPKGEFRKKYIGEYVCVYLYDKEKRKIYVIRIIYGRRDMTKQLKKL